MTPITGIIFDMDGLMFDTEQIYFEANAETLKRMNIPFELEDYKKVIGSSGVAFYENMLPIVKTDENYEQFIVDSDAVFYERITTEDIPVKEGLYDLLEFLASKRIPLVVASSSNRQVIETLLTRSGVIQYFEGMVGYEDVAEHKPHPAPFYKAQQVLGVSKEGIWIIEDSLNGIRAAYEGGFDSIMVPDIVEADEEARLKATKVMDSLVDVRQFFEKI